MEENEKIKHIQAKKQTNKKTAVICYKMWQYLC